MATKVAAGLGTLACNNIYPITYAKNAVQLWADGPYFATTNVGGAQKYQWGATAADGTANSGAYDLDHDTAYKIWGSAWRMPTMSELRNLVNKCTKSLSTDYIFTSNTSGYGSISLPKQFDDDHKNAYYWSADPSGDSDANYLWIRDLGAVQCLYLNRQRTLSGLVRAVLATPAAAPAPTPAPTSNLLAGEFSVSADKKVQFTKGNLWCNTTTNPVTYAFETNQYDYPVLADYTSDGAFTGWLGTHVGHFFWTTAAADSYAQHYYYSSFNNTTSDKFWLDGSDADHKLTVSGISDLYVLSSAEWTYLLETRANHSSLYKCGVTVAGKANCLIIAPDDYTGSIATEYTAAEWATAEAAGLVCLPIAGYRDNNNPFNVQSVGNYWTSTAHESTNNEAMKLCFMPSEVYTFLSDPRQYGFAIRLVKTITSNPAQAGK